MGALLAADIEDTKTAQVQHRLQQQRRLANARLTAQEDDAARHKTAAEDAIQFAVTHRDTVLVVVSYLTQPDRTAGAQRTACNRSHLLSSTTGRGCGSHLDLLERIPLSAGGAFAYPFRRFLPAVRADVCYLILSHPSTLQLFNSSIFFAR